MSLPLTRHDALLKLEQFLPKAGGHYAKKRNYDCGMGYHEDVSQLSAALRRRLLCEEEVILAVYRAHGLKAAEKYIQEVFWRTYWKGWLEMRPSLWDEYLQAVSHKAAPSQMPSQMMEQALTGTTGLACYDDWFNELVSSNYLHNHARMWFASIWIFTFGLPWQSGAHLFMTHLMDGDPASNTLGWRWVAGLQTRGKAYAARADNIDQFTHGRHQPYGDLNEDVVAVAGAENPPAMGLSELRGQAGLTAPLMLATAEDSHLTSLKPQVKPVAVMGLPAALGGAFRAAPVLQADQSAIEEAASALAAAGNIPKIETPSEDLWIDEVLSAAHNLGADHLLLAYQPVGYWQNQIEALTKAADMPVIQLRRAYDELCWPHAKKGFFPFKEKIPHFMNILKNS